MPVVSYLTIDGEVISETRNGVERDYLPDPLGSTVAGLGREVACPPLSRQRLYRRCRRLP